MNIWPGTIYQNNTITPIITKHKTYARATAADIGDPQDQTYTLEQQVLGFFDSKGIHLEHKGC